MLSKSGVHDENVPEASIPRMEWPGGVKKHFKQQAFMKQAHLNGAKLTFHARNHWPCTPFLVLTHPAAQVRARALRVLADTLAPKADMPIAVELSWLVVRLAQGCMSMQEYGS